MRTVSDANRTAVELLQGMAHEWRDRVPDIVVTGMVGPRGDGYAVGDAVDADEAADYHAPQVRAFAEAGAQAVCALTLTDPGEAVGVVRASDSFGLPVGIGFTVETDGRLPDGTTLQSAIEQVDAVAPPAYFLVNCAHPQHVLSAFDDGGPWVERVTRAAQQRLHREPCRAGRGRGAGRGRPGASSCPRTARWRSGCPRSRSSAAAAGPTRATWPRSGASS